MPEVSEVTLRQFIDSVWFKGLARSAMILSTLVLAGFATAWAIVTHGVASDLATAQANIVSVAKVQDTRATDAEAFQTEVRGAITGINGRLENVDNKMFLMKVDIGVIKNLLQKQRDVADAGQP